MLGNQVWATFTFSVQISAYVVQSLLTGAMFRVCPSVCVDVVLCVCVCV